ncbi:MAG: helix-turn-helix domain-containing protein [Actinomycetota bacterium]|nr:helix-turn-helix domain-containing protein [Actinomycetota bacterium]
MRDDWPDPLEAARLLGLSEKVVYALIQDGKLPARRGLQGAALRLGGLPRSLSHHAETIQTSATVGSPVAGRARLRE